jgi:hypothetical protein
VTANPPDQPAGSAWSGPAVAEGIDELIRRSRSGVVQLPILFGMDLWVLGGAHHALADLAVTARWIDFNSKQQAMSRDFVLSQLWENDLLLESPATTGQVAVTPELGLVLQARSRPTFAVLAQVDGAPGRPPFKLYAVGDQSDPVQAMLLETPQKPPPDHRSAYQRSFAAMRELMWMFNFRLVSPERAMDMLAAWASVPVPVPDRPRLRLPGRSRTAPARSIVVVHHHEGQDLRAGALRVTREDGRGEQALRDEVSRMFSAAVR